MQALGLTSLLQLSRPCREVQLCYPILSKHMGCTRAPTAWQVACSCAWAVPVQPLSDLHICRGYMHA
eukprot:1139821-Pelagomonas_calceolata.AAC.1